jgi:tRNA(Ile2) C34 agmatinyltransferase TiaS
MTRRCPECGRELPSLGVRCACGHALPEARDLRSDPDRPRCGVCGAEMALQALRCPSCGADGYPALRARRGKRSLGAPD